MKLPFVRRKKYDKLLIGGNDTVYSKDEEAKQNAIKAWNTRTPKERGDEE